MAKLLYFIVCFSVIFGLGYSLKCHKCSQDNYDGCAIKARPGENQCGAPGAGKEYFCYYMSTYDSTNKKYTSKSDCVEGQAGSRLDKTTVPACKSPPSGHEVRECRVCQQDMCNSASLFSTSLVTLMCLPVTFFLVKFLHH